MRKVTLVWGPPASGKTTYVKRHMADGDLVVDLDAIKEAIGFRDRNTFDERLMPVVWDVRDYLYELIANDKLPVGVNVWVIAGVPKRNERYRLTRKLGVTDSVFLDVSQDECMRRALIDRERTDKELQLKIIRKWFAQYETAEIPDNFYHTTAWRNKRKEILKRDNYECQLCKEDGGYSKGNVVHHIEHLEDRPDLALDSSNLMTVCEACHNKLHPEKLKVYEVDKREYIAPERW